MSRNYFSLVLIEKPYYRSEIIEMHRKIISTYRNGSKFDCKFYIKNTFRTININTFISFELSLSQDFSRFQVTPISQCVVILQNKMEHVLTDIPHTPNVMSS